VSKSGRRACCPEQRSGPVYLREYGPERRFRQQRPPELNGWNTGLTLGLGEWFGLEFNFANVRHSESDSTVVSGIGTVQRVRVRKALYLCSWPALESWTGAGPGRLLTRLAGFDHK